MHKPHHLLLLIFLLGACSKQPETGQEELPPSVILISLDTLRAGHTSIHGYERETTPFLEEIAADAAVFERAIATSCWTLISHLGMLTGLYAEQHGVIVKRLKLSQEVPLIQERLLEEGYQTLAIYREGWISSRFGFDRGFEVFRSHEDAPEAAEHMWEELDKLRSNLPFFMFLHLFDIHAEELEEPDDPFYDPPPPFDTMFQEDAHAVLEGIVFDDVREGRGVYLNKPQKKALVSLYDGNIAWIDSLLREWWAEWERRGLLKNTLVIITSDHGESLGQRGGIKGHGAMFQDGLHVPMVVRFPDGYLAGQRPKSTVSHVDIAPTILDVIGFEADDRLAGYSLRGTLPENRVVRADKAPHHALVQWPLKLTGVNNLRVAYHLEEDPLELDGDKIRDHHPTAKQVAGDFAAEFADRPFVHYAPVLTRKKMPPEDQAMLEALGYAGDLDEDE